MKQYVTAWPMCIGEFTYGGGVSIEYIFLVVFGLKLKSSADFQLEVISDSSSMFQFFISFRVDMGEESAELMFLVIGF